MDTPAPRNEVAAEAVAQRLHRHRDKIAECLNPLELWTHLVKMRLLRPEDCRVFNDETRAQESISLIFDAVESKGEEACLDFLRCLEGEREHLGHEFAASLLRGEELAPATDVEESKRLFEQIRKRMPEISDSVNLNALLPALYSKRLLTSSEAKLLNCPHVDVSNKVLRLFSTILVTKGPTAYQLFADCLKEERQHLSHQDLYDKIMVGDREITEDKDRGSTSSRKEGYTSVDMGSPLVKVKRIPLLATGILISPDYFKIVSRIHELNYEGQFQQAQRIVDLCKWSGNVELYVAVSLRNCEVLVNRKKFHARLSKSIQEAEELCQTIPNDNRCILRSRLCYVKAHLHRYRKEHERAEKHIGDAMDLMIVNGIQGEDAVLVLYERACINMSSLTKHWSPDKFEVTKLYLERATDFAMCGKFGLYVDHHRIRLAQLHLRSSTYHAGTCTDPLLIREARRYLGDVDCTTLTPRTKCLYQIALSDLHRNTGELQLARNCAQEAERIARDHQFDTELYGASQRSKALRYYRTRCPVTYGCCLRLLYVLFLSLVAILLASLVGHTGV